MKNMKAISPVIATVIIVAVAITIAIAVAFWMTGLAGTFTRYEKLEITYAYAETNTTINGWTITLKVRNTGSSDATIDDVFINGKPYDTYTGVSVYPSITNGISLSAGSEQQIIITISGTAGFTNGQVIEVKLHSAAGNEYPKQVTLP